MGGSEIDDMPLLRSLGHFPTTVSINMPLRRSWRRATLPLCYRSSSELMASCATLLDGFGLHVGSYNYESAMGTGR